MVTRAQLLPFLAGAGVVALFATSMVAVSQAQRAGEEADRADRLEARVLALETEVAELEAELEAASGLGGLLDGLLGGGDLGGLLDGLLGGDTGELGDLGGLLDGLLGGAGGQPGDLGGLDELFDGLLGGSAGGEDLFGSLFGTGGIPGAACMTPDGGGLGGMMDGLLGGGTTTADADLDEVVATVTAEVEQLRELTFDRDVEVAFLDDDALGAELTELLDEAADPDQLAARAAGLAALRAVPADLDLDALQRELLDDQVAGYYVPAEERLVVRSPDDGTLSALDRIVLAHELEHALADQSLGLPDLDDGTDADAALARLSVVEGDATLTMNRWALQHLTLIDQLSMFDGQDLAGQTEVLERVPHHLRRELLFPYTAGLDHVCDLWLDGGWAAVDAAYADLPTTTAAVLFPDRDDAAPADVPAPTAPSGVDDATTDTFGAAELLFLLEAPGDDPDRAVDDALQRAAAWAGGELTVWTGADTPTAALVLRDRADGQAPALCGTVTSWTVAAYGSAPARTDGVTVVRDADGAAAVRCDDDVVTVGFGADVATARAITG